MLIRRVPPRRRGVPLKDVAQRARSGHTALWLLAGYPRVLATLSRGSREVEMAPSKRSPPPPASEVNKRQRVASNAASRASTPASQPVPSGPSSPDADSLSSLTDSGSRASSPEVELASAVKSGAQKGNFTSHKVHLADSEQADRASTDADGDGSTGAGDDPAAETSDRLHEAAAAGHHDVSAKTVPSGQGAGKTRPTQGGKGRKGEEALEHAVATREEVERRRARLKEENGVGVAGARELEQDPQKYKVKMEDQEDVEVVHGAEAEELVAAAPVRRIPPSRFRPSDLVSPDSRRNVCHSRSPEKNGRP